MLIALVLVRRDGLVRIGNKVLQVPLTFPLQQLTFAALIAMIGTDSPPLVTRPNVPQLALTIDGIGALMTVVKLVLTALVVR